RFGVFALYLVILGVIAELDSGAFFRWSRYRKWSFICAVILAVFLGNRHFSLFSPVRDSWPFRSVNASFEKMGPTRFPEYGRYWIIGDQRSADFGIDSLLQVYDPEISSVKGLYWESSRNNLVLSSYLATLLSAPVVLDHFYYWGYSCGNQKCIMDHFFRDYNVRGLMMESDQAMRYLRPERRDCYREIASRGETNQYRLKRMGEFSVLGTRYSNYWIEPKTLPVPAMTNTNHVIEVADFKSLVGFDDNRKGSMSDYIKRVYSNCEKDGKVASFTFLPGDQFNVLRSQPGAASAESVNPAEYQGKLEFRRLEPGKFRIRVPGDKDVLLRIKLNYFPLLELKRADGSPVRLFDAFPHMLAVAHGDLVLEFKKSWIMFFSYFVSILGALLLVLFFDKVASRFGVT
ncbi:MAG: hypothetical protein KGQ59_07120, partial [Bdellovibrionales bacterium]|nr:hypothetical protein [Bdellovibrionales bacterium]